MDNRIKRRDKRMMGRSPVAAFLDKQGIYLVMLACLAIIGIAAYFTLGGNQQAKTPVPTPSQQQAGAILTPKPTQTLQPVATPNATPTATTAKPAMAVTQKAILPVQGEVLRKFSLTDPVYFETINAWITHNGVDIKCAEGTAVKAALDGTVSSVKNDPETGYTIVLKSANNVVTVYGNLAAVDNIKVGQAFKQGEVLGAAGRSAQNALNDPAHVHFGYLLNGKYKDPIAQCK